VRTSEFVERKNEAKNDLLRGLEEIRTFFLSQATPRLYLYQNYERII